MEGLEERLHPPLPTLDSVTSLLLVKECGENLKACVDSCVRIIKLEIYLSWPVLYMGSCQFCKQLKMMIARKRVS